jgi:hypothetical protein
MTVYAHFLIARNAVQTRVARFFFGAWYQNRKKCTKRIQNEPNAPKISQISIKYSKWP